VAGVSSCLRSLVKSSNVEAVLAEDKAKGTPSGLIDFRERVSLRIGFMRSRVCWSACSCTVDRTRARLEEERSFAPHFPLVLVPFPFL